MRKRALSVLSAAGYDVAKVPALAALVDFAAQKSGMDWRNYFNPMDRGENLRSGRAAYRSDARRIARAWGELCKAVAEGALIGVEDRHVIEASQDGYSSRLSWIGREVDGREVRKWEYTAGFAPDEMRFFGTKIESGILPGCRFVTSEQPPHGRRMYSVRSFDSVGKVNTVGEFCAYSTREEAMAAARNLEVVTV